MTAPNFMRSKRATCPECGSSYQVDRDGRLKPHPEKLPPGTVVRPGRCEGTGQLPETER